MRRNRPASLASGLREWRRRGAKVAIALIGLGLVAAFGLRGYGQLRLHSAKRTLARALAPEELTTVAALQHTQRPAFRLASAIGPLAGGRPEGEELLTRCRTALDAGASLDLGRDLGAAAGSAARAAYFQLHLHGMSDTVAPASSLLLRCGLAGQGGLPMGEFTLPAVELLGTVARDLERGPSLLAFAFGLTAERNQLRLIERLHASSLLGAAERARLGSALITDDLALRRRQALAGEAAMAMDYALGYEVANGEWKSRPLQVLFWFLGPLSAAAHVDEISRILREEPQAPAWIDTFFVGRDGLQGQWRRLLQAPTEVALRRERVRRLLEL